MNVVVYVTVAMLLVAAALTVWRAVRPGSVADRSVAIDVLAAVITCGLFAGAALRGDGLLLDLALVFGLLGFLTSIAVARFVERKGT